MIIIFQQQNNQIETQEVCVSNGSSQRDVWVPYWEAVVGNQVKIDKNYWVITNIIKKVMK